MSIPPVEREIIERGLGPILFTAAICLALVAILSSLGGSYASLAFVYLIKQDVFLALLATAVVSASLLRLSNQNAEELDPRKIWIAAITVAVVVLVGRQLILLDYDMSRDEQMATFDAAIFRSGQLAAMLSEPWPHQAGALNTDFMLPVADRSAWVSGYLPINAAIRGIFDLVGASQLVGPLAVAVGALALDACVTKIWPDQGAYRWIALLLYLGSGQVLVNGMTTYAMSLHLTLNLVWLSLFLERRTSCDVAALIVGFMAVGLHQPLFHPMFAAPILATLLLTKDWQRAAFYFFAYAMFGAFWAYWPSVTIELTGMPLPGDQQSYLTRLQSALDNGRPAGLLEMIANLLRFVTWQHLLLLPLLILGLRGAFRSALFASFATGIILTIAVMTIILPYQGHGFGYRYLHGLIGSAILLAVHGWDRIGASRDRWTSLFKRTSIGTFVLLIPAQLYFANAFYAPYARASHALDKLDSDYVVISGDAAPFAVDLVINEPFLQNRPIRLVEERLATTTLSDLCAEGPDIIFVKEPFFDNIRSYYSLPALEDGALDNDKLTMAAQESGCIVR